MESLHVPASVMHRLARFAAWGMPSASLVFSVLPMGYRWVGDRASMAEVAKRIAPVAVVAREGQALGAHCSSLVDAHVTQLALAWGELVALHGELKVYRAYSKVDPARRNELLDQASRFYRARYAEEIKKYPTNPAEAARIALLQEWRPDR